MIQDKQAEEEEEEEDNVQSQIGWKGLAE